MRVIGIAVAALMLSAAPANAKLLRGEVKTLGMD
jgi:hypothetical protein